MAKSVGILTSTGGLASHAAVVARGWDIPAVVGAVGVVVGEGGVAIGETFYREGHILSIDGSTGEVFGGAVSSSMRMVPEAARLLAWADELGIKVGPGAGESALTAPRIIDRVRSRRYRGRHPSPGYQGVRHGGHAGHGAGGDDR